VEENIGSEVFALQLTKKEVEPTPTVAKQMTMDKKSLRLMMKKNKKGSKK
jgi:hypothetical protein